MLGVELLHCFDAIARRPAYASPDFGYSGMSSSVSASQAAGERGDVRSLEAKAEHDLLQRRHEAERGEVADAAASVGGHAVCIARDLAALRSESSE